MSAYQLIRRDVSFKEVLKSIFSGQSSFTLPVIHTLLIIRGIGGFEAELVAALEDLVREGFLGLDSNGNGEVLFCCRPR